MSDLDSPEKYDLYDLPTPKRYITTHANDGKSIFYTGIPEEVPCQPMSKDCDFYLIYTTTNFPTELGGEQDIVKYRSFLEGTKPGLTTKGGSVVRICDFRPVGDMVARPLHRTLSIDFGIVLAGEMEASLDSGETRSLKAGDIVIQRETMHAWKNPSTTKWARMIFILQQAQPLEMDGKKLTEDYGDIPGLAPSS